MRNHLRLPKGLIVGALLLGVAHAGTAQASDAKKVDVPPPPSMPAETVPTTAAVPAPLPAPVGKEGESSVARKPDTTTVERDNTRFTEYRLGGRLYMIKVEPKVGPPYYLYDETGDGLRPVSGPDNGQHLSPPRWVLFTF